MSVRRRGSFSLALLTSPLYQAVMVLTTFSLLAVISYYSLTSFRNFDPAPQLSTWPVSKPVVPVKTGLYINNFLKFDVVKNNFTIDAVLWFEYDPKLVSLAELQRSFFSKGKFIEQATLSEAPKIEHRGQRELARFNIKLEFVSNLNYRLYPFDNHRLFLVLNNKHLTAKDKDDVPVMLQADQASFVVAPEIYTPGWKCLRHSVRSGYAVDQLDRNNAHRTEFPRVIFEIDFMNNSIKDILIIILPLFVVFFMALLSFHIMGVENARSEMRALMIAASAASALLSYRFVISSIAPSVDYFMFIDQIFN
ncbi:MAG TPA: hypothetical protein VJJ83_03235, partial [Candidatus Babeliales bacterium]|nr:hypothetical protein [Candidatus Babeliales bacterium]